MDTQPGMTPEDELQNWAEGSLLYAPDERGAPDPDDVLAVLDRSRALERALRQSADRLHSLSDEPPHMYHVFNDCPDYKCQDAQSALLERPKSTDA